MQAEHIDDPSPATPKKEIYTEFVCNVLFDIGPVVWHSDEVDALASTVGSLGICSTCRSLSRSHVPTKPCDHLIPVFDLLDLAIR